MQHLVLALPIGLVVGLLLGALGGGGAILAVPALVYLLGQSPRAATAASLVIVIVSASTGIYGHWRAGRSHLGAGAVFAAAGIAGSVLGSRLSGAIDPNLLLLGFAGLMLVVAAIMFYRQRQPAPAPAPPAPQPVGGGSGPPHIARQLALIAPTATGIGFLTGLFGVGGGIIVVPTLLLVLGFAMPAAIGTSLVVIILNSLFALGVRLGSHVTFDWPLIAVFTVGAVAGTQLGTRIAGRADSRRLTQGFIVLIVVVAGYIAARSLFHAV
jgi:uncharacterized membrane protein YfcA